MRGFVGFDVIEIDIKFLEKSGAAEEVNGGHDGVKTNLTMLVVNNGGDLFHRVLTIKKFNKCKYPPFDCPAVRPWYATALGT